MTMLVDQARYDRQLRLWQLDGQLLIENANICVINLNALSCELIKNLILPGVNNITIIDELKGNFSSIDISNNFFLTNEDLNQPKRKNYTSIINNLKELNSNNTKLNINVIREKFDEQFIEKNQGKNNFWLKFDLVVVTNNYNYKSFKKLLNEVIDYNLPVLEINSVGFFGYYKIYLRENCIIETNLNTIFDSRINEPFEQLKEYTETFQVLKDIDNIDSVDGIEDIIESLKDIPYVVLLIKFYGDYLKIKNNKIENSLIERKKFKKFVRESIDRIYLKIFENNGNDYLEFENFNECINKSNQALISSEVSEDIQEIIDSIPSEIANRTNNNNNNNNNNNGDDDMTIKENVINENNINNKDYNELFWKLVLTLKSFVKNNIRKNDGKRLLPLSGILPDMESNSVNYIKLKGIYYDKFKSDKEEFINEFKKLFPSDYDSSNKIDINNMIEKFCKNCNYLVVQRNGKNSLSTKINEQILKTCLGESVNSKGINFGNYYIALIIFFEYLSHKMDRDIGGDGAQCRRTLKLEEIVRQIKWEEYDYAGNEEIINILKELVRSENNEIHNISSLMGGIGSQEVIKLITKQYTPIDNTMIFDGLTSSIYKWKF
ncbi:Ula1p ASCRUDRAFT_77632 [Ascoidea rubescens DSM 1968]|uniref:THIF-type NAD/FAD binding fold domain-containing protein n=1 Tax=Ascoidea rubescens DSM 1968 TaxID=1344418 RepID=A0A1D2VBS5_9ASCO|nr:hypothetical protein ASCRUDRAFT_77632 [Ascoidea rubescens DSM 1968]ODV58917.1 hypothetical protein ASCRUDRAFT_77632 [Ascoidea rubescens DSM 1968]